MSKALSLILLATLSVLLAASTALPVERPAAAQETAANGLGAEYFDTSRLTSPGLTRTDAQVNFSWGKRSPARGISRDTFSARWTGQIEAPSTGTYHLYTRVDDGVRLWVDGDLLVDRWSKQRSVREYSAEVTLHEGMRHDIKMEFFEDAGSASAKLLWSGPGLDRQLVPSSALFPTASPPPPPPPDAERWSEAATWDGEVPQAGQTVTVPEGKTVLLDTDTPRLAGLVVRGTLIFEEKDLVLKSDYVMVHGKLQIGTEAEPFQHRAKIVLTATDENQNIMNMGTKFLGAMGGQIEIHGQERAGWTRLAATADKGTDEIVLENDPGWRAGDQIVIASTDYDSSQAEERTITNVAGNTLTFAPALEYTHWGEIQTLAGRTVDERAEVGLLSRNVTIEGEATSSADGFGGQIMAMDDGAKKATMKIEGAELYRMGQKNVLRRYPIHFHMLGDNGSNSYLKDSSIHEAFNRCVTVHGTNNLAVSGNVCHDHLGHGFFMEDGAEHDNVIENNLGLTTKALDFGERLLQSDGSAATFWITNPDNVVRNNVAAGSEGTGFWLAFAEHPTGLFARLYPTETSNTWLRRTPLGEFSGNVAHSTNGDGLHVDSGPIPDEIGEESGRTDSSIYDPRQDPTPPPEDEPDSAPVIADFRGFVAYKNRGEGVWLRGSNHRVTNAVLADNAIGATFASSESFLEDSLVVGETSNKGTPERWQIDRGQVGLDGRSLPRYWEPAFPIRGYEFYDGRVGVESTTFVNFHSNGQRRASALGVLLKDAFHLDPGNYSTNLDFVNADRVYLPGPAPGFDGDRSAVFTDTDGSATGTAGSVVTANNPFLTTDGCTLDGTWNAFLCPPGTAHATLIVEALTGVPTAIKPLTITRGDGVAQTLNGCCDDSTNAYTNILPDREYGVAFNGGTPTQARFVLWNGAGHHLRLVVPYPVAPKVSKYGCDLANTNAEDEWCRGKKTSLDALDAATRSAYYYDDAADKLYLKLVDPQYDWEELEIEPRP